MIMNQQPLFETNPEQNPNPAVVPEAQPAPVPTAPVTPDPLSVYEDLAARVTNPDGTRKYGTISDALNALPHSQEMITKQQQEIATLKEELAKRQSVETQLQQMREQVQPTTQPVETPQPSEKDLAELVSKQLQLQKEQDAAESNRQSVQATFAATFGDKAAEVWNAKASELGVNSTFLDDIATKSPQAIFKMFGLAGGTSPQATTPMSTHVTPQDPVPQQYSFDKPLHKMSTSEKVSAWRAIAEEVNARHNGQ